MLPEGGPEDHVAWTLCTEFGATIIRAGTRSDDYDLEIEDHGALANVYLRHVGLVPGRYEVKSLWRKNDRQRFDRRIKVGRRGERIYGRRDAAIKAFALGLEDELDFIVDGQRDLQLEQRCAEHFGLTNFVIESQAFIDAALDRRHSKSFDERLRRLARVSLMIPRLSVAAQRALTFEVHGTDIVNGFEDIAGIFIVAGATYTLVSQREMAERLAFDSASVEGPRLRFLDVIPSEPDNVRKEKGSK